MIKRFQITDKQYREATSGKLSKLIKNMIQYGCKLSADGIEHHNIERITGPWENKETSDLFWEIEIKSGNIE